MVEEDEGCLFWPEWSISKPFINFIEIAFEFVVGGSPICYYPFDESGEYYEAPYEL